MLTSALLGAKSFEFFEIYGVRKDKRGEGEVEPVRTFFGQEGEGMTNFCNFVRTSFMDGP